MCVYVCVHKFYLFIYREFYSHTRTSRTLASTRESPALVFRGISLIRTPPTSYFRTFHSRNAGAHNFALHSIRYRQFTVASI